MFLITIYQFLFIHSSNKISIWAEKLLFHYNASYFQFDFVSAQVQSSVNLLVNRGRNTLLVTSFRCKAPVNSICFGKIVTTIAMFIAEWKGSESCTLLSPYGLHDSCNKLFNSSSKTSNISLPFPHFTGSAVYLCLILFFVRHNRGHKRTLVYLICPSCDELPCE